MQPRLRPSGSGGPEGSGKTEGADMAIGKIGWFRIFLGGAILAVAAWSVFSGLVLNAPSTVTIDLAVAAVGGAASAAWAKISLLI